MAIIKRGVKSKHLCARGSNETYQADKNHIRSLLISVADRSFLLYICAYVNECFRS